MNLESVGAWFIPGLSILLTPNAAGAETTRAKEEKSDSIARAEHPFLPTFA